MKDDPIVAEARAAGQKYIDSFHGNWKAIIADLDCRAEKRAGGSGAAGQTPQGRRQVAADNTNNADQTMKDTLLYPANAS